MKIAEVHKAIVAAAGVVVTVGGEIVASHTLTGNALAIAQAIVGLAGVVLTLSGTYAVPNQKPLKPFAVPSLTPPATKATPGVVTAHIDPPRYIVDPP